MQFRSPKATEAIVPRILDRVWTVDNDKQTTLWEMGNQGGVSGDCFVKVAYEEPYTDAIGRFHPGRCRVLPLNSSFAFPEFHPHDRSRLIRFKLKYKFWGTSIEGTRSVFCYTELITDDVIEEYINDNLIEGSPRPNPLGMIPVVHIPNQSVSGSPWGLSDIHDVIALNREFNEKATDISDIINYHACVDDQTEALTRSGWRRHTDLRVGDEVLTRDPQSDEIVWQPVEAMNVYDHAGPMVRWDNRVDALTTTNHRWLAERRVGRPENQRFEREFVRTSVAGGGESAAADLRHGSRILLGGGIPTHFPAEAKYTDEFVETVGWFITEGCLTPLPSGSVAAVLHQSDTANPGFVGEIRRLQQYWQRGGGSFTEQRERPTGVIGWYLGTTVTQELLAAVPDKSLPAEFLTSLTYLQAKRLYQILLDADGSRAGSREVWYQDDQGRVDGFQMLAAMLTGGRTRAFQNVRGNGVVDVYQTDTIEILSTVNRATEIEYNGVVWCPTVANGVWFARRGGSTYWTGNSPVTVVTGAKASQLEKGPKKVWSGLPKDAQVFNLELGANLQGPMEYMAMLKTAMHEMTGVHETALGQQQAISNTSGVALAIQYLPLMQVYHQKRIQYEAGLKRINELILLTISVKEPMELQYSPQEEEAPLRPGQLEILDPSDPLTYMSTVHWPPPLPIDVLVKLNEEMLKMQLGLQSKRGAMRELGEQFPDEKMSEVFNELIEDMEDQGALDLKRAAISRVIMELTGMNPAEGAPAEQGEPGGPPATKPAGGEGVQQVAPPAMSPAMMAVAGLAEGDAQKTMSDLVTKAYGSKLPQRRSAQDDPNT